MQNYSFVIVDDEKAIVTGLKVLIMKNFPDSDIYTANDGNEAFSLIQQHKPMIVISDIVMPGLNGIQLCKKIRSLTELDEVYIIILTANDDTDTKISALDEGANDILSKPPTEGEIVARIRSAAKFISLQRKTREENELLLQLAEELERDINDMIMLSIKFLQTRIPASREMLEKVAKGSVYVAKKIGGFEQDELFDIEIASYLCYAGKISLPDEILKMPTLVDGQPSHKLMYQIPTLAKEIVSSTRRFSHVADILYSIFENFDGSGFPEKKKKWQIPLSARIIRLALDYYEARYFGNESITNALASIKNHANRLYDPKISILFEQYLAYIGETDRNIRERAILLSELEEGLVLSRDVYTTSGMKLIPAGAVLREKTIERILSHNTSDPILGNIFIKFNI